MAGGIDWFRWHHGSVTDPKFQLVARKAGVRLPDVLAVWAFVLEKASASDERGSFGEIDCEAVDCLFGLEEGQTAQILEHMGARGLVNGGQIAAWEKRQPKRERDADNSTERTRAYRERQKQLGDTKQDHVTPCDATEHPGTPREEKSREEKKVTVSEQMVGGAEAPPATTEPPPPPPTTPPAPAPANPRGTRLPADWQLPKAWGEWALAEYPHWTADIVRIEAAKFKDHWTAKTGKGATSLDWVATWRNWCRSDIAQRAHAPRPAPRQPTAPMDTAARNAEAKALLGLMSPTNPQDQTPEVLDA